MPLWAQSGFWGFVAGSALLLGAALGFYVKVKQKVIAWVMAFGGGVLISAVAFDLMDEAFKRGGFDSTSVGFLAGALAYTAANYGLSRYGAKHRKRSGKQQPSEAEESGSGLAIAVGALLDGIPESMAIGIGLLHGGAVSWVMVAAIFLSNVPEGLSSSAGMKHSGRSARYVFGVWTGIMVLSALASIAGNVFFIHAAPDVIAAITAVAAGAILCMLADRCEPDCRRIRPCRWCGWRFFCLSRTDRWRNESK
jgi:ZIP family zinc transporter